MSALIALLLLAGHGKPAAVVPAVPQVAPEANPPAAPIADPSAIIVTGTPTGEDESERRIPGLDRPLPPPVTQRNPGALTAPPPQAFPQDHIPVPDRWRLAGSLGLVKPRWFDPYNQNLLKGDIPLKGHEHWFLNISAISDTVIEPRSFPIPVGVQTTQRPGSIDTFGRDRSLVLSQTFIAGASLIKGSTAFKPPEIELRIAMALNFSYVTVPEKRVLFVEPTRGTTRYDQFIGLQELFLDYHLRNTSDRYDFDSLRVGIQPFSTDFRGFLFQDNQLGIRLFGDRDNNRFQYNLAAFIRIEKDTNSGLNDVTQRLRNDYVFIANLYRQDLPVPGLTSQVTAVYNMNREAGQIQIDDNGFPVRPSLIGNLRTRDYDVVYLGYNADGKWGRINVTASAYAALGEDRNSIFTNKPAQIRAFFAAVEPSIDFDWVRVKLSGLYASGDKNPYDNRETGFDAIFENPQFAGSDTSYYIRQTIPFAGGGRAVNLNSRNGILNNLRSSKEEGQSNFQNPGTVLLGVGADFDVLPELRLSANVNHLWFANTTVLQALRVEGSIPRNEGFDLSAAAIYRPHFTQNLVLRVSGAIFDPGAGFRDLFANASGDKRYYSVLINAIASF